MSLGYEMSRQFQKIDRRVKGIGILFDFLERLDDITLVESVKILMLLAKINQQNMGHWLQRGAKPAFQPSGRLGNAFDFAVGFGQKSHQFVLFRQLHGLQDNRLGFKERHGQFSQGRVNIF